MEDEKSANDNVTEKSMKTDELELNTHAVDKDALNIIDILINQVQAEDEG